MPRSERVPLARPAAQEVFGALATNNRLIWGVIGALLVAAVAGYWASGLSFADWRTSRFSACVLVLLAFALFYRKFRPDPWIVFGAESTAQLMLLLSLATFCPIHW